MVDILSWYFNLFFFIEFFQHSAEKTELFSFDIGESIQNIG